MSPEVEAMRERLRAAMPELAAGFHVRALGLFGSRVRGDARLDSDLDVLVEFEKTPTLFSFVQLEDRLTQLLGTKVDLVMKSSLRPNIGRRILAEVVQV
jgi:predicted nucleotidyltransferase